LGHSVHLQCVIVVCRNLEVLHRKEQETNSKLLSCAQYATRQLSDVQKKLTELQNVQSIINGQQNTLCNHYTAGTDIIAVRIVFWFHFKSNRIVIVGLKRDQ